MPAIVIAACVVLVLALAAVAFFGFVSPSLSDGPTDSAEAIRHARALDVIAAQGCRPPDDSWQLEPSHRRPTEPFDVVRAHTAMQQHKLCSADTCGAKRAAMDTLEAAGRVKFDERVVR